MTEPFWEVPRDSVGRKDRILLITYHFPPACSAGALRWQKLAAHAHERGWELDVITLDPVEVQLPDPTQLRDLPPGTRVYGVPRRRLIIDRMEAAIWTGIRPLRGRFAKGGATPEATGPNRTIGRPGSLAREELRLRTRADLRRAYNAWRSAATDSAWSRSAARLARRIFDPKVHRVLVTCGPPHMVHVGGARFARSCSVPHMIDMRDPWSLVERLPESFASPVGLALARRAERRVIASAALVVANTEPAAVALRRLYPSADNRIIAVMNGYDDAPLPVVPGSPRFTLAYAGTVYLDRDPRPLFRAVARVRSDLKLGVDEIGIEFMGDTTTYNGRSLLDLAADEGIAELVKLHPLGTRTDAERFLAGAAMLVSLPQDSNMAIPSKVFDYLRHSAWVLALAEPESATAVALRGTRADVVSPLDEQSLVRVLHERIEQHRRGQHPQPELSDGPLSRKTQAQLLFDAFEKYVARPTKPIEGSHVPHTHCLERATAAT